MKIVTPTPFNGSPVGIVDERDQMIRVIKLVIRIRWFVSPVVFLLLFFTTQLHLAVSESFSLLPSLINTGVLLIFNLIYRIILPRIRDPRPLAYFQLTVDALYFTFVLHNTGGLTSPFIFLYFAVIFVAAILISGLASIFAATICALLYSGLIVLEFFKYIPHVDIFIPLSRLSNARSYLILTWIFSVVTFYAVGFLALFLFQESRKQRAALAKSNKLLNYQIGALALFHRTTEALNSAKTLSELIDQILTELLLFLKLDRVLLYMSKESSLKLYMAKYKNPVIQRELDANIEIPLRPDAGLTAIAFLNKQAFNIRKPVESKEINRPLEEKIGKNPFAVAPLILQGKALGVLGIDRCLDDGEIADYEFEILKMFANQAAIAISGMLCLEA